MNPAGSGGLTRRSPQVGTAPKPGTDRCARFASARTASGDLLWIFALDRLLYLWQIRSAAPASNILPAGSSHGPAWDIHPAGGQELMRAFSPPGWRVSCASPGTPTRRTLQQTRSGERISAAFVRPPARAIAEHSSTNITRLLVFGTGRRVVFYRLGKKQRFQVWNTLARNALNPECAAPENRRPAGKTLFIRRNSEMRRRITCK